MTTETEQIRETIEGVLETATDAPTDAKRGPKRIFEFRQRPEDTRTVKVTWWPPRKGKADPPVLTLGARYSILLEKKSTGEEGKFYRDFVSATPMGPLTTAQPAPSVQPEAPGAPAAPTRSEGGAPSAAWEAIYSAERQTALTAAVKLGMTYPDEKGRHLEPPDILAIADIFAAWIAGAPQEQPQAAQGPAPEPAAVTFEDLGPAAKPLTKQEFVDWCKAHGLTTEEQVAGKLGMKVRAWLTAKQGRTLADALKALEAKPS